MFRKLNKSQLTKIKQQNFIGICAFDSRLYLDISRSFKWKESFIFRYFKVFQLSQMLTCGLSDLLLLVVGLLVVFVLRKYILKLEISKYKRESKAQMPIKFCCLIFVNCDLFSFLNIKKVKIYLTLRVSLIIFKNLQLECILHYLRW
jgi:hypothetical protein